MPQRWKDGDKIGMKKEEHISDPGCSGDQADPLLQYDEIFSVTLQNLNTKIGHPQKNVQKLYTVLKRGLGDRITLLDIRYSPPTEGPVSASIQATKKDDCEVEVSLLLNPEVASRLVDHGPSADDQEASREFRAFWGDKAELRRFRDGSISESLVWSASEPVTLQILSHLVARHFKQSPSLAVLKTQRLEDNLLPQRTELSSVEAFKHLNSQFQKLSSFLHQLEGLPLAVRSISPVDPALRSSVIRNPLDPLAAAPINVLIQFDSSTRWPDSLPAIQYTKIAFLLKLSELMSSSDSSLEMRVGLENTSTSSSGHLNTSFLDISYPPPSHTLAPTCFRLRIYHDRELHLLQTALADKSLHGSIRDQLTSALAIQKQHYLAAPLHSTTIQNLTTKFPALSTTIRLLKKWASSHLLSRLVPEETLEIIAAHIFLHPSPWSTPSSPSTAFYRCIWLLARWDWAAEPLIVDLSYSQDMSAKSRDDLRTRFQAWRKLDPNMNKVTWFIGTNIDETGVVWTTNARPEKVTAARVRSLAGACMEIIKRKGSDMSEVDVESLFRTPMEHFDFLLHLTRAVTKGKGANNDKTVNMTYKNLQITSGLELDEIGFDPVELYLRDLEKAFGNVALFFHGTQGEGKVIAGLWRPNALGKKEWRVRMGFSTLPLRENEQQGEEKTMGEFNGEAVLSEIAMMGEGIVKKVDMKRI
ncbi:hypothetical protein DV737_g719, partial [Chaetothyriales sp. CBS 132003]